MESKNKIVIKVTGLQELMSVFGEDAPKQCKNLTRSAVHSIATQMAKDIKEAAPFRTGNLKMSIKSKKNKPRKNGVFTSSVIIRQSMKDYKADGFYWRFLEYGTLKIPANPFIRPVRERYSANMKQIIQKSVLDKLTKKLMKKSNA